MGRQLGNIGFTYVIYSKLGPDRILDQKHMFSNVFLIHTRNVPLVTLNTVYRIMQWMLKWKLQYITDTLSTHIQTEIHLYYIYQFP